MGLHVIEERHESEVHVELLVTVEQRHARIVGHEIKGDFLVSAEHHYIFHDACGGFAHDVRKFEDMPVQVDRMQVVALIAHVHAVTTSFM